MEGFVNEKEIQPKVKDKKRMDFLPVRHNALH